MKADFIIIGAQKSGTTSLAQQLELSPHICFSREKEPHFFSLAAEWSKDLGRYHELFDPEDDQICGEASTSYSFLSEYPHVPKALYEYNPSMKLIYIMRSPVERIISHYSHKLMRGLGDSDPEREILRYPEYIDRTRYGYVISEYLKVFPRGQMLFLVFEEYVSNPSRTLQQICSFLGVPELNEVVSEAKNKSTGSHKSRISPMFYGDRLLSYSPRWLRRRLSNYITIKLPEKPVVSDIVRRKLWESLEDEVQSVEQYLGRKLPWGVDLSTE
jgi:hypothetical protein